MRRLSIILLCLASLGGAVAAEVIFSDLDLSAADRLLFRTQTDCPGYGSYGTLFLADLKGFTIKQLTFFPERVMLLEEKGILQLQNRFGVFRSDAELKRISPIATFPSFSSSSQVDSGKLNPLLSSPNGRYLLYLRQKSPTMGDLILLDVKNAEQSLISSDLEYSLQAPPALWSADSQFFVYCKSSELYYMSIGQLQEKRVLAEEYRLIGEGQTGNVQWGGQGSALYYLSGSLVYRLEGREFFTRALYTGYLKVGKITGKIPFRFDPNFDSFWISPDGTRILLNKGGRNVFLYLLANEDFLTIGTTQSLPYLLLPRNTVLKRVLWTSPGTVTILAEGLAKGKSVPSLFRLAAGKEPASAFQPLKDMDILDLELSPFEDRVAVLKSGGVALYAYESWSKELEHPHPQPLHVLWASEEELIIAGASYTELWNFRTGEARIIALSQPGEFGFAGDEETIHTKLMDSCFTTTPRQNGWEKVKEFKVRERKVATESFRAYLEEGVRPGFQNMVMMRDLKNLVTRSLIPPAESCAFEAFPAQEDPLDLVSFSHGSRIRRREAALVFNVIDGIEGLTTILNTLREYKIRATFFVNGEAMRRNPDAVREIASSGHEVGSLFYEYFNMTDSRFRLDKDFIKRGLARNEDLYYETTRGEFSLLWHAPYYFVNSVIIEASKEMNYTYIGRDLDPLDWVTGEMNLTTSGIYFTASRLVERILGLKKPGSIVPILAGIPEGTRADYLFQKLDLLINGLLGLGYEVVPVTTLIQHAQ